MSIIPCGNDTESLKELGRYDYSVKYWRYDKVYNSNVTDSWKYAQMIKDTYFTPAHYPQNINIKYKVQTYTWNYTNTDPNDSSINLYADLSDKVVSVSYDCDSSSNIKMSANLTLLVPPDDDFWYMNREYDVKSVSIGKGAQSNIIWQPQLYYIEQIFEFPNDEPEWRGYGATSVYNGHNKFDDNIWKVHSGAKRILGFFLPDSGSYSYDTTTNQLTLQLQGLAKVFTPEMGGGILTPISSFDYYFDMPYNNNPTKILAYRINEEGEEPQKNQTTMQKPVPKTKEELEKEYVRNSEQDYYDNIPQIIKDKGVVFGTAPVVNPNNNQKNKRINVALPLSISGTDGGFFIFYFGVDITEIIFNIAMCRTDGVLNKYHLPLVDFQPPSQDCEMTSKSIVFPNGWDFENSTSIMNIAEKMLGDKYYEPTFWVDEDRYFCVEPRATIPTDYREYIPFRNIQPLIIDEDISMDDNEFYTVTEVYGKDGEYYGVYDGSFDGFKTILGNTHDSIMANMGAIWYSEIPKVQVINDDGIESDDECYQRALYETWKSSRGHTKITVKLRDNMIYNTCRMSHIVGKAFVEYRTIQGNGKTILCNLDKASLSDGIWTWELTPFSSYAPTYDDLESGEYHRWKTEHYDEWIGTKYNEEWLTDEYKSELIRYAEMGEEPPTYKDKNTLATPVILGWELIDKHIIRLYITSIDIGLSVVKMWSAEGNGAFNTGKFLGESVNTNGTDTLPWGTPHAQTISDLTDGKHIYKIFDYPVTQNGSYMFVCELYSPFHESSMSKQYIINVSGVEVPDESGEYHAPYLTDEYVNILTDENKNRLTI